VPEGSSGSYLIASSGERGIVRNGAESRDAGRSLDYSVNKVACLAVGACAEGKGRSLMSYTRSRRLSPQLPGSYQSTTRHGTDERISAVAD
jgi:hypothetical protein